MQGHKMTKPLKQTSYSKTMSFCGRLSALTKDSKAGYQATSQITPFPISNAAHHLTSLNEKEIG